MRGYHVHCIKHKIDCFVIHKVRETNSDKSGSEIKEWDIGKHHISQKLGLRCKLRYISLLTPHIFNFFLYTHFIISSGSFSNPPRLALSLKWKTRQRFNVLLLNKDFIKKKCNPKTLFILGKRQQGNLVCFLLTFRAFRETTWTFVTMFR